ncbi:MAG TPA: hypothetical protein VIG64_09250 [Actinomycetota bacterium]|jgi:hypothetical protein
MERPEQAPEDASADESPAEEKERDAAGVEDEVDEASDNSFPASDPPAY